MSRLEIIGCQRPSALAVQRQVDAACAAVTTTDRRAPIVLKSSAVPRVSLRSLIYDAPTVLDLRLVMEHSRTIERGVAPNTLAQWENACYTCAEYFMDNDPARALWIYNTLFMFLRFEQRESLLARALRRYARSQQ